MTNSIREKALTVLQNSDNFTPLQVHNSIIDLRRNGEAGDEKLLIQFLNYPDEMVVAATLFAFLHVYKEPLNFLDILVGFAQGDDRDTVEMPIQTQAIEGLYEFVKREEVNALAVLIQVAKDETNAEVPRARSWGYLAKLFGVNWQREYTEAMIWDPDSERSKMIREEILEAIDRHNGIPIIR